MRSTSLVTCVTRSWWTWVAGRVKKLYRCDNGGARVVGIDISPDLIAIANQRLQMYGIDAELRVASAYETHLEDKSADVVFCMSILHHLQLGRVKDEILRILKPDGLFIFKEPIRFSWTMKKLRTLFPPKGEDISEFEHPLDDRQINTLIDGFQVLAGRSFRTPLMPLLTKLMKAPELERRLRFRDAWMLTHFPPLVHFATIRVMALQAHGATLNSAAWNMASSSDRPTAA